MCADGKNAYREQGYKPRDPPKEDPRPKDGKKTSTGTDFQEDYIR